MAAWGEVIYQTVLYSQYQGQACQNVLWFRSKPTSNWPTQQLECDAINSNVNAWFVNNVIAFANFGWQPLRLVTKAMNGPLPVQTIKNYVAIAGARTGEGLPPHDAAVISLYTPFHGKRLHGRIYITGISEQDQSGGLLEPAALVRLNTIGTDLMTRFAENGSSSECWGVVYSRMNGVTRSPGPPPHLNYLTEAGNPWTRYSATQKLRTQRHRLIP